jgi:SAM-dependent methyltransferase
MPAISRVSASQPEPPCPISGAPPRRHLQWLSTKFLAYLWRFSVGVDVSQELEGVERLGLWESPVGLLYFDPPRAGNQAFYRRFYRRVGLLARLESAGMTRDEFARAASCVGPGDRLLDVGCGEGALRTFLPGARYTGLDLHFGGSSPGVLRESIEAHAPRCRGFYDVACAFQVLEHVPDPLRFARAMVTALRPGGRLLIGVPSWPSPATEIPNFVLNAPPHHLTLWSQTALQALAERLGLVCHAIEPIRFSCDSSLAYWMGRCAPKHDTNYLFHHAWSWHAALLWCYGAGRMLDALRCVPADAAPAGLLLIADKRA